MKHLQQQGKSQSFFNCVSFCLIPNFLNNACLFIAGFFIHYGSIPYLILFVVCQVSMCTSQREAALCFILLINTKAFNISFLHRRAFETSLCLIPGVCETLSTFSASLPFFRFPFSVFWVCLQLKRLHRTVFL